MIVRWPDLLRFSVQSLRGYPLRSSLTLAAMAIGVAAGWLKNSVRFPPEQLPLRALR